MARVMVSGVPRLTKQQAQAKFRAYDLETPILLTGTVSNDRYEAVISDYRPMVGLGYEPIVAVAIYEWRTGRTLERFNIVNPEA